MLLALPEYRQTTHQTSPRWGRLLATGLKSETRNRKPRNLGDIVLSRDGFASTQTGWHTSGGPGAQAGSCRDGCPSFHKHAREQRRCRQLTPETRTPSPCLPLKPADSSTAHPGTDAFLLPPLAPAGPPEQPHVPRWLSLNLSKLPAEHAVGIIQGKSCVLRGKGVGACPKAGLCPCAGESMRSLSCLLSHNNLHAECQVGAFRPLARWSWGNHPSKPHFRDKAMPQRDGQGWGPAVPNMCLVQKYSSPKGKSLMSAAF